MWLEHYLCLIIFGVVKKWGPKQLIDKHSLNEPFLIWNTSVFFKNQEYINLRREKNLWTEEALQ